MNSDKLKVEAQVLVDGKPAREYGAEGRVLIEGSEGSTFTIKIRSSESRRVKAVVAVDGINVVSGKPSLGTVEETGYVLAPFASVEIEGWRTSNEAVAKFVFTTKEKGYAQHVTSTTSGMGVIGVAFVLEKEEPKPQPNFIKVIEHIHHHHERPYYHHWYPDWPHYPRPIICGTSYTCNTGGPTKGGGGAESYSGTVMRSANMASASTEGFPVADSAPSAESMSFSASGSAVDPVVLTTGAGASPQVFNLGTGWGDAKASHVTTTLFIGVVIADVVVIHYTDLAGLKAVGVDVKKTPTVTFPPAFGGYCQPPTSLAAK